MTSLRCTQACIVSLRTMREVDISVVDGPDAAEGRDVTVPPMDIVCISSIDWDFIWQGHQQIMATLAAKGHRVLFIENTGVRAPRLRDASRLLQRLRNWRRGTAGFRQEGERLFVYAPLVLPFPYSWAARWINREIILRAVRRWASAVGFNRPVVWTFLPTPLVLDLVHALDPALTVYYCIDDFASSSAGARRIMTSEAQLLREADLVFVTSGKLQERAAAHRSQVELFPFGVDFDRFAASREEHEPPPADLQSLPRPIAGYLGGLHQWIDQPLLVEAARRLPHVSFALIGPRQTDTTALEQLPNVHLLGTRTHTQVPAYLRAFDVGLIPYRRSDYTAHVYPTKLNEYLAAGLPVVTTDLPEIERFNRRHADIVTLAKGSDEFIAAIERALRPVPLGEVERRIAVARQNSWPTRIADMETLLAGALEARRARTTPWQESMRRMYRAGRRRVLAAIGVVLSVYLVVFQTSMVWWIAEPLRVEEAPRPADAIVVFAGGVGESGQPGGGYQERVSRAVALYDAGLAPRMIFSSGYRFVFREAEVMKTLAVASGVPADAIELEEYAASTYENVALVAPMLERDGVRSVLLVSSPYHMRRALLVWRARLPGIEPIPTPVIDSQFYFHRRGASLEQIRGIAHEYAALIAYWLRGWV